ncbi:MAG: hypothetical protein QW331_00400 [Candidatus Woesearchaeota archaeon]
MNGKDQCTYFLMTIVLFVTFLATIMQVFSLENKYFLVELIVLLGLLVLGVYGMMHFYSRNGWQAFYVLFFILLLNQIALAIGNKASWIVSFIGIIGFCIVGIKHYDIEMKKHKVRVVTIGKSTDKTREKQGFSARKKIKEFSRGAKKFKRKTRRTTRRKRR